MNLNQKQRENLAKFFYDIAKLSFAGMVVAAGIAEGKGIKTFALGLLFTACNLLIGIYFDQDQKGKE